MSSPMTSSESRTPSALNMPTTVGRASGPPYPNLALLLEDASDEFRALLLGVGQRCQLPGRADMLAGKRISPHGYATLLLLAMRQAGLGRADAERWIVFNRVLVERLWAADRTPLHALERQEQQAEDAADQAQLLFGQAHCVTDLRVRDDARRALYDARLTEVSCELAVLAHPEAR
jgi:hypothetical protein